MIVHHLQLLKGARKARGIAVVIDVFRASSNVVTMFARGASVVVPVAEVEQARVLKGNHPDWILAGEREGLPPEGFDLGNSPAQAGVMDFTGKTVVLTTSAGTRGLVAAAGAGAEVLVGCFMNAQAVIDYLRTHKHEDICFIALGVDGQVPSPEDNLCAQFMEMGLTGFWPDPTDMFKQICEHPEGRKFLDPTNLNYNSEDLHACLQANIHDIVPVMRDGVLVVE